ncbi:hypothetical protein [Bergeriella denitrificans]|uniref:Uncharacterized protein n=1 Tax=Bergeriella denitrificans TaxID=494 RepID=A0A378UDD0_BERDE|nr:hypothetical protein [Bergeriella denitrificans]STZ75414.1 Uncharacterised protein [Bergeriella denitrificans]
MKTTPNRHKIGLTAIIIIAFIIGFNIKDFALDLLLGGSMF